MPFPPVQFMQQPQIFPSINMSEDEKVLENVIEQYYIKYSSTHSICDCESCKKLLLPFMIARDTNYTELPGIFAQHESYYLKCQSELDSNESKSAHSKSKLNNVYFKNIFLGEVKFKFK